MQFMQRGMQECKYFKGVCVLRMAKGLKWMREVRDVRRRKKLNSPPHSASVVTTAARSVVDFLETFRTSLPPSDTDNDEKLKWCIQAISDNRLFDVQVDLNLENRRSVEVLPWIRNFSKPRTRRRSGDLFLPPSADEFTRLTPDPSVPDAVSACLRCVLTAEFDIFALKAASEDNELLTLMLYLLVTGHLTSIFPVEQSREWLMEIQLGYDCGNQYHTATHACDVVQTFHWMLVARDGCEVFALNRMEVACCYLAGCVHDFQHPGVSNKFLISTRHPLATLYNDRSVLENHHIASAFALAESPSRNLFQGLKREEFACVRRMVIGMVMATDITRHFGDLSRFRSRFEGGREGFEEEGDKGMAMEMMMHCCDISNPSKPWPLCRRWADLILQEFFSQGDREKALNLPISDLCDRQTTSLSTSQIAFIEVIVFPSFESLSKLLPRLEEQLLTLHTNKEKWREEERDGMSADRGCKAGK